MCERTSAGWQVVAAAVRGAHNEQLGRICQDAYHWTVKDNALLIAALSDGAGSSTLSHEGAFICASTAVELLLARMSVDLVQNKEQWSIVALDTIHKCLKTIEEHAARQGTLLNEFAATLLVAVACPHFTAAFQIGDGAIVIEDQTGSFTLLTQPDKGEYINETFFLTSNEATERAAIVFYPFPTRNLAIFTDGLEMLALQMPDFIPYPPFFQPLFELVRSGHVSGSQLEEFLCSARVRERTGDDIALLLAYWG